MNPVLRACKGMDHARAGAAEGSGVGAARNPGSQPGQAAQHPPGPSGAPALRVGPTAGPLVVATLARTRVRAARCALLGPVVGPTRVRSISSQALTRRQALAFAPALPLALAGCAAPGVERYAAARPELDLRRYFDGPVTAHGMFSDRWGEVRRRFTVAMACSWKGEEGVLDEQFLYDDGERQRRVWHLRHLGQGAYVGRADDVVGEARGQTAGNAFRWGYTLRLPVDGRVWEVDFDDWMFLIDERVLLNRATMSRFGLRLGEVQLAFSRPA
jgi:Protein of unknown function (DUF3833)